MPALKRLFTGLFLLAFSAAPLFLAGCGGDDEDLTPPALTLDALTADRFSSTRVLTGTVEPNATIDVLIDGEATLENVAVEDGEWRATLSDLTPGGNVILVSASDGLNTRTLQFVIFYNVAQIERYSTVVSTPDTAVFGRVIAGADVTVLLNGVDVTASAYSPNDTGGPVDDFTINLTGLNEGVNTLVLDAVEPAGDGDLHRLSLVITRNLGAVALTIDAPALAEDDLTLSGSAEAEAEVTVVSGEETFTAAPDPTTLEWSVVVPDLPEGPSVVTVTASAPERTASSGQVRVEVDTAPVILEWSPGINETGVPLETGISVLFDQTMVGSTVDRDSFQLLDGASQPVAGSVNYDAEARRATFTPASQLAPSTIYTVELTAAMVDAEGNPLAATEVTTWDFTTATQ